MGLRGLRILGHVSQVGRFPAAGAQGHLNPTQEKEMPTHSLFISALI